MTTQSLVPLQHSFANGELEAELKQLIVDLYTNTLAEQEAELNVYGAPHLGDLSLVQRFIQQDGLSVLNSGDFARLLYLFKAWRYRNPRRGLHFATTYLQVLFGTGTFTIGQLWQRKDLPYPTALATQADITAYGYDKSQYFLTSRVRVDITTADAVPTQIATSLRTTLPARLLLEFRVRAQLSETVGVGNWMGGATIVRLSGTAAPPLRMTAVTMSYAQRMRGGNIAYLAGQH